MNTTTKTPIVLIHGLWMTPEELGHLGRALPRRRPPGHRARLARHRRPHGRGHPQQPGGPEGDRPQADRRQLRAHHPRAAREADHHRPLVRRRPHPDARRPRPRRRLRRRRPRTDRRRHRAPALDAVDRHADPLEPVRQATAPSRCPSGTSTSRSATTCPASESDKLWEEYAVNSYNRVFFEGVLSVLNEKGGVTHVDYARTDRAPLLIITGEIDHVVPPAIGKAIVKKYQRDRQPRHRGLQGVPGPHPPPGEPGRLGGDRRLRAGLGDHPRRDRDRREVGPILREVGRNGPGAQGVSGLSACHAQLHLHLWCRGPRSRVSWPPARTSAPGRR